MHDWTFETLMVDWLDGSATFTFRDNKTKKRFLTAEGLVELRIPKREAWGESISVNEIEGPSLLESGNFYLSVEIQSGDKVEVEAKSISLPKA